MTTIKYGGDGLALARLLINAGYHCTIFMLAKPDKLSELTTIHYNLLMRQNATIQQINSKDDLTTGDNYQLVVDAIFGVSLNRPVSGLYAETIGWLNDLNCPIMAVDVPSGVAASTGQCLPIAVKATKTVTFAAAKIGLYLYPAAEYVGQLIVAKIGIPQAAYQKLADNNKNMIIEVLSDDCLGALARRSANSHKGSYGHALLIAGSKNMAGAAMLAAKACAPNR